jgi:hypothetical protein
MILGCLLVVASCVGTIYGQAAANPTGTWKWEWSGRDGQTRTSTLKLKLEGDRLTGVMLGRNDREFALKEGSFKDNTVAFKVTRQFGDREMTQSYTGKLEGNSIKGKVTFDRQGETVERDWEAKRS